MTTALVYGVESFSDSTLKARLIDVSTANVGAAGTARVLEVSSVNLPQTGTTARVLKVDSVQESTAQAALSAPSAANPGDLVTLDATASIGTVTSITQTAGTPTVTLLGTGAARQFVAPAINSTTTTPLTFRATVSGGGTSDVVVQIYPHTMWICGPDPGRVLLPLFIHGPDPSDSAPIGPWPGWGDQVYVTDFPTPVLLGGFVPDAEGNLTTLQGGSSGYQAYGAALKVTADNLIEGANRRYPSRTMSVTYDGYLDIWLHQEGGLPLSARILPTVPSQTYGRYAIRFRTTTAAVGWSAAIGLVSPDGIYPDRGQIDFPAGNLSGDVLSIFTPASPSGVPLSFSSGQQWTTWHEAVIEWDINTVKTFLDDTLVYSATVNVPSTPMILSIRPAGNSSTDAHLQIDWIAAWAAGGTPLPTAPEYIPSPTTYPGDTTYPGGTDVPVSESVPSDSTIPSDALYPSE